MRYIPPEEAQISDGRLQLVLEKIGMGGGPMNFFISLKVRNVSNAEQVFERLPIGMDVGEDQQLQ